MTDLPARAGSGLLTRLRFTAILWLFLLPSLVGLAVFTYYPNLETVKYSFFKWDGGTIEEFRAFENFRTVFGADPLFWQCFGLIGILLAANLVKMWPSIFTAIVLHRLRSERWQYVYRVLFVIPMVIPGLVGLLLWKSYFDANLGPVNQVLNATGLMSVLRWLDTAMPALAAAVGPSFPLIAIAKVFGGLWGLALFGAGLLLMQGGIRRIPALTLLWLPFLAFSWICWGHGDGLTFAIRGTVLLAAVAGIVEWLRARDAVTARSRIAAIGWGLLAVAAVLILLTAVWTEPTRGFVTDAPAWLGNSKLVIPAVILWGFPWIGTVGVLIYLAGLANISKEVYEAAELDGIGFWGKIFRIEVPLIMTQVRINLIFMTIGTLGEYGFFLILLGIDGGPGNVGMTPGLYMYRQAFIDGNMGYACALGMILFIGILYVTVLYQRHVKVDK